jgi:hypothetical protein
VDVGTCEFVVLHADDDGSVEGGVGLAVLAAGRVDVGQSCRCWPGWAAAWRIMKKQLAVMALPALGEVNR